MYSAPGLVSLMQSWVGSGMAYIMFQSSRLHLDPTCNVKLDSLSDTADCIDSLDHTTTSHYVTPTTVAQSVDVITIATVTGGVSKREIGGIAVGVAIIVLLAVQ